MVDHRTAAMKPIETIEQLVFECLEAEDSDARLAEASRRHPELADQLGSAVARAKALAAGIDAGAAIAAPSDAAPGTAFGPYRTVKKLGSGGMGVVYLAEEPELGRLVALKLVRGDLADSDLMRARFRREVEAVAALQHPNIAMVHTVGEHEGQPYFAMEYVEGRSLAAILEEQPTTPLDRSWVESCIAIVRQIASALDHAHARGVLHRDVKPSNVLLDGEGRVRLVDFGLARTEGDPALTQSTAELGSLPYMPPESLRGQAPISPTLDVYSLGVTLFELLALQNPFRGSSAQETRRNIQRAVPPRLRELNSGVGRDLESVCLVAMDPDPTRRYATMAAFGEDLGRVLGKQPIVARRPDLSTRAWRWMQRHPTLSVAAGVLVLMTAIAAVVVAAREHDARQTAEALTKQSRSQQYRGNLAGAAAMFEGQANPRRAYALLEDCPQELRGFEWGYLAGRLDEGTLLAQASGPSPLAAWLPTDGHIAVVFPRQAVVHVVDPASKSVVRTVTLGAAPGVPTCMRVAADGSFVVGRHDGVISHHDGATGEILQTMSAPGRVLELECGPAHVYSWHERGAVTGWQLDDGGITWRLDQLDPAEVPRMAASHDGRRVAVALRMAKRVIVFDTGSGERVAELGDVEAWSVALAPDGGWLWLARGAGPMLAWQVGEPAPVRSFGTDVSRVAACSKAGILACAERERDVALYATMPGDPARLALIRRFRGHTRRVQVLGFEPDGKRLLTTARDSTVRVWDLERPSTRRALGGIPLGTSALTFVDDSTLIAGGIRGEVTALDIATNEVRPLPSPHTRAVASVEAASDRLLSVGWDDRLVVWDLATWQPLVELRQEGVEMACAALHPDGSVAATGGPDGRIVFWDVATGRQTHQIEAHGEFVASLAFTRDGSELVSAAEDGTVRAWSWHDGILLRDYRGFAGWVRTVLVTGDDAQVIAAGERGAVVAWERSSGRRLCTYEGPAAPVFDLAVGPDNERLFSIDSERELHVWKLNEPRSLLVDQTSAVAFALAVAPDGTVAAAGMSRAIDVLSNVDTLPEIAPVLAEDPAADPRGSMSLSSQRNNALSVRRR